MTQSALIDLSNTGVLCIDDDQVIRSVVRQALNRHGCHDVVMAHGGQEALDLCSGRRFDLLICDYQMRPMNGLDFLRELANLGLGEGWPVIMLSAETDPATIQEAQELGVRAWIGKPVSLQVLIENIGTVLFRTGQITRSGQDPELKAMVEQHHARLMAALRMAEEANQGVQLRPREIVILGQALRHAFDDANEHARHSRLWFDRHARSRARRSLVTADGAQSRCGRTRSYCCGPAGAWHTDHRNEARA